MDSNNRALTFEGYQGDESYHKNELKPNGFRIQGFPNDIIFKSNCNNELKEKSPWI